MVPPVSVTGPMTPPRRRRRHGRASSVSRLAASFTPHHRRPQNLRGCFFLLWGTKWVIQITTVVKFKTSILAFRVTVRPWDARFFGKEKIQAAQNSCNFCYFIGKMMKNCAAQGFWDINLFSLNFFGPNSKTCTCKVRAAWDRVSRGLIVIQI